MSAQNVSKSFKLMYTEYLHSRKIIDGNNITPNMHILHKIYYIPVIDLNCY